MSTINKAENLSEKIDSELDGLVEKVNVIDTIHTDVKRLIRIRDKLQNVSIKPTILKNKFNLEYKIYNHHFLSQSKGLTDEEQTNLKEKQKEIVEKLDVGLERVIATLSDLLTAQLVIKKLHASL